MKIAKALLTCMCCLIAVPAVWSQAASAAAKPGILGYLDPHTGAFRPIPQTAPDDAEAAAATTFGGTVTVTLTITLKTTSITNVTCSLEVSANDGTTSFTSYAESNTVAATGSGTTRSCKLSVPYSWSLVSQSTDNMTTSYNVFGSTGTTGLAQRSASRFPLDTRKVPINGTTTTLTASVTL
jgi:hypothetical protein